MLEYLRRNIILDVEYRSYLRIYILLRVPWGFLSRYTRRGGRRSRTFSIVLQSSRDEKKSRLVGFVEDVLVKKYRESTWEVN